MKLNFKLNKKKIITSVYLIILIVNIVFIYYIYSFINENVYKIIYLDEEHLISQTNFEDTNINMNKFEAVKEFMTEKKKVNKINNLNNIFN